LKLCLQQGIEAVGGKHVHFVDQVHLEATAIGSVLHVFEQFASVLDLGTGSGVHLDQVHKPAGVDFLASSALTTGRGGHSNLAVQ